MFRRGSGVQCGTGFMKWGKNSCGAVIRVKEGRFLAKIGDRGGSVTRVMVAAYVATVWEKGENGSKGSVRESVRTLY